MVSSGTVSSDSNSLSSILDSYSSEVSSLASSWKGLSYDNLSSKAEEFVGEFSGAITGQMSSFATACDLYEKYVVAKKNYKISQQNYNNAKNGKDNSAISRFSNDMANYKKEMENLKSQIESQLSSAAGVNLTANSSSGSSSSGPVDFTDDENFQFYSQNDSRWANKQYGRKGQEGATDSPYGESACGPTSLAMVMASLGQNVDPTDIADWCTNQDLHHYGTDASFVNQYTETVDGISSETIGVDTSKWKESLENGELIVLNVGPGDFTSGGHYMVIRGYDADSNSVLIADPYGQTDTKTWWNIDRVAGQSKNAWAVGKD